MEDKPLKTLERLRMVGKRSEDKNDKKIFSRLGDSQLLTELQG